MPFVLDVRASLPANVIQRVLIKSGRDSLFDSFDRKLGDAARMSSERTLTLHTRETGITKHWARRCEDYSKVYHNLPHWHNPAVFSQHARKYAALFTQWIPPYMVRHCGDLRCFMHDNTSQ